MLRAGIVGLPNVGKSTLFNAITRTRKAEAANYPFCTVEPNVDGDCAGHSPRDAAHRHDGVVIPAAIGSSTIAGP